MHVYTVGEGLGKGEIINTYILHARVTKTRCVIVAGMMLQAKFRMELFS